MPAENTEALLDTAASRAREFLKTLPDRPVGRRIDPAVLRERLGGPLPEDGEDPRRVLETLATNVEPGLVASAGPRYFGFVIGGSQPVTLATEWLTAAWDQNAVLYLTSPAGAVAEEIAAGWITSLLGLPARTSVGFVTGAMMANFTALAAARHEVLRRAGWDVEAEGLQGAPRVNVVAGEEAHATILAALRFLGLGERRMTAVAADGQGRMRVVELHRALERLTGPTIVCAQAGNVNTGAIDPLAEVGAAARDHGAWLHVDGAFGLWAAAVPALRHHLDGVERADSWALDAHKWLNVPYDCGIAITAHPDAHRAAMRKTAAYLLSGAGRDPSDWTPEASRRARAFSVYAAIRALGRRGLADLVTRCCRLARLMAEQLRIAAGVEILNEVVLNQVLVRFHPAGAGEADDLTRRIIARVQEDGTCWLGGTTWHGMGAMRISVSGWETAEEDIIRSARAILAAYEAEGGT
jgi:glutamate/tyrosine decarboxylase-like PLP-dependent enzyme